MLSARDLYEMESMTPEEQYRKFSDSGGISIFTQLETEPFPRRPIQIRETTPKKSLSKYLDDFTKKDVAKYSNVIINHYFEQENDEHHSCSLPRNITNQMYNELIAKLFDIKNKLYLYQETFFTACYIIKFCLSDSKFASITFNQFELLGLASLKIAEKSDQGFDAHSATIKQYIDTLDNIFTKQDFLKMEQQVLNSIHFHTTFITPISFLLVFSAIIDPDDEKGYTLAKNIAEYCLTDFNLICSYLPSQLAIASQYLANWSIRGNIDFYTDDLEHYSRMSKEETKYIATQIYNFIQNSLIILKQNTTVPLQEP